VTSDDAQEISVAGNLCETGDMFAKRIELPVPKRGDILAVLQAGAYCRSMASAYNTRDIPKELLL
jgi:diaminopimelate decarboxylase